MLSVAAPTRQVLGGLFARRERWGLSGRGWLVLTTAAALLGLGGVRTIYPFLAVTHRAAARVLVVEGWVHEYAIRSAVREFVADDYIAVISTGGPVKGTGGYLNDYSTAASIGAQRLQAAGIPADCLHMVASRISERDRTYHSALALREWLDQHRFTVTAINVLTEDVHARRTQLLFQKAFGKRVTVGVIAVPSPDYDSRRWWHCSEGVREVLGETISYFYARVFFFPGATARELRPSTYSSAQLF
jgi:uncharacterized SAM-binding protein YcdF (DUF218 family)